MPDELQIFTIGHSSHPMGSFLWLLRKHGIEALVDIRRFPGSRKHPHFSRENLALSLADEDMEYHWLEALGGRRHRKKKMTTHFGQSIGSSSSPSRRHWFVRYTR